MTRVLSVYCHQSLTFTLPLGRSLQNGQTALILASMNPNNLEVVQVLVDAEADVNVETKERSGLWVGASSLILMGVHGADGNIVRFILSARRGRKAIFVRLASVEDCVAKPGEGGEEKAKKVKRSRIVPLIQADLTQGFILSFIIHWSCHFLGGEITGDSHHI